jgi:hypothetical protein
MGTDADLRWFEAPHVVEVAAGAELRVVDIHLDPPYASWTRGGGAASAEVRVTPLSVVAVELGASAGLPTEREHAVVATGAGGWIGATQPFVALRAGLQRESVEIDVHLAGTEPVPGVDLVIGFGAFTGAEVGVEGGLRREAAEISAAGDLVVSGAVRGSTARVRGGVSLVGPLSLELEARLDARRFDVVDPDSGVRATLQRTVGGALGLAVAAWL